MATQNCVEEMMNYTDNDKDNELGEKMMLAFADRIGTKTLIN